jgi:hypothetical protein
MGMCSTKVDYNLGIASLAQAQTMERLGERQADLSEEQFREGTKLQRDYLDLIKAQQPMQERLMESQADAAELGLKRQQEVQWPLEDQLIEEASNYDSAERVGQAAGRADAAVIDAYDRAQAAAGRDMRRMGVDPNSGKAVAQRENGAIQLASAAANASSTAAEAIKSKGFAMRMDAAGLGRNLGTNSTAAADASLRAGQAQASNHGAAAAMGNQNFSTTMAGFGSAGQSFSNAARTYDSMSRQQTEQNNAASASTGAIVGAGLGAAASWAGRAYGSGKK